MTKKQKLYTKGAVALSSIMVLSIILLVVALSMAFSSFVQTNIVYNQDKAINAFYIAEAGAKDAMQKVARNKNYTSAGYVLAIETGTANIVVSPNTPVVGQTQITSVGTLDINTKKIRVILNVGANGEVTINSWNELSI